MVGGGGGGCGRGVKVFLNNDKKLKNRYFGASLILLKGAVPNLAPNWHFLPYIGLFGPFDPMPTKKQSRKVA